MKIKPRFGFHEAGIADFRKGSDGTLLLSLEDVHVNDEVRKVSVQMKGVLQITRDGLLAADVFMECAEGEVLTLETGPNSIHLVAEWHDFTSHRTITSVYRITADSVLVEVL